MKKSKIIAAVMILTVFVPVIMAAADSEYIKTDVNKFVSKYAGGSKSKSIVLNDIKQKSDNYTVINNIEEAEKQLQSYNDEITDLEEKLITYDTPGDGMYKCLNSLNYQKIQRYELNAKLELYKMQSGLDDLYIKYSPFITEQQTEQLEYEGYKLLQEITAAESKLDYLKKAVKHKSREVEIMSNKLDAGYAVESDVLASKAALESAKAEKALCENEITQLKNRYEIYSGTAYEEFAEEIDFDKRYNTDDRLEKFRQKSFYARYCQEQAMYYSNYSAVLHNIINEMNMAREELTMYYASEDEDINKANLDNIGNFERVYRYISGEAAYYSNEAAIMRNNAEQYEISLELYVTQLCGGLEAAYAVREAKTAEVRSAENQLVISHELLFEGRITEIDLMELESTVYKLRYDLAAAEAEILCSQYVLDNLIESG